MKCSFSGAMHGAEFNTETVQNKTVNKKRKLSNTNILSNWLFLNTEVGNTGMYDL